MSNKKTSGYREPADLPIEVALCDPLDGDFLWGDDNVDYDPLRQHSDIKGSDRSGRPGPSEDRPDRDKKKASFYKRADKRLDIELVASQLVQQDPRFQAVRTKKHRDAIAILSAGLQIGLPYMEVSDLMFGDFEPIIPDIVTVYGFPEIAGYMTGEASVAPPLAPKQREDQLDSVLREWAPAKGKLAELGEMMKPLLLKEQELRAQAGGLWQDIEAKARTVDGILYKYNQSSRANPSYKQAIDKLRELVDVSLHPLIDAAIEEFTSYSRVDTITMKGKVKGQKHVVGDLKSRKAVVTLERIDQVLNDIMSVLEASGMQGEMQIAASKGLFDFAQNEPDWMADIEARFGDKSAIKKADRKVDLFCVSDGNGMYGAHKGMTYEEAQDIAQYAAEVNPGAKIEIVPWAPVSLSPEFGNNDPAPTWRPGDDKEATKTARPFAVRQADVRWVTSPTINTCQKCLSFDGQSFQDGMAPECPVHPNCRCQLVPVEDDENLFADVQDDQDDGMGMGQIGYEGGFGPVEGRKTAVRYEAGLSCRDCGGRKLAEMGVTPPTPVTTPAVGAGQLDGQAGGFKEGDQVLDGSGRRGTAKPSQDGTGGMSVQFDDGSSQTFDQTAVQSGAVKRAGQRIGAGAFPMSALPKDWQDRSAIDVPGLEDQEEDDEDEKKKKKRMKPKSSVRMAGLNDAVDVHGGMYDEPCGYCGSTEGFEQIGDNHPWCKSCKGV